VAAEENNRTLMGAKFVILQ